MVSLFRNQLQDLRSHCTSQITRPRLMGRRNSAEEQRALRRTLGALPTLRRLPLQPKAAYETAPKGKFPRPFGVEPHRKDILMSTNVKLLWCMRIFTWIFALDFSASAGGIPVPVVEICTLSSHAESLAV